MKVGVGGGVLVGGIGVKVGVCGGVLVGMKRGALHWLLSEPHFPGNLSILVMHLILGVLGIVFAAFLLVRGGISVLGFAFLLLGTGILLFGLAETVSLGPRRVTVAGRVVGLLAFPIFVLVTLVVL